MARNLVILRPALLASMPIGARPVAVGAGVDVTAWRLNGFGSPLAAVTLDGTVAANVSDPGNTGKGPEVWGLTQGKWYLIGVLNNNAAIAIVAAGQGFAQELDVVGVFDRLAIAGTVSAGVVTAGLMPMESYT